jgi:hypothetical protein
MELKLLDEIKSHYPIELIEHSSPSYAPRTYVNAHEADLTIAFAVDYTTAGERCTIKAAGRKYLAVPLTWDVERAARHIKRTMFETKARKINIAGNGVYTLVKIGYEQFVVNKRIYQILKSVHAEYPIEQIRSGGQTGVDTAGLVAGMALNIPSVGLFPKGFRQRTAEGVDMDKDKEQILIDLMDQAYEVAHSI